VSRDRAVDLRITQERIPPALRPIQNLAEKNVQLGRRFSAGPYGPFWRSPYLSRISIVARTIRAEVRSCFGRICVLCDKKMGLRLGDAIVDLGPIFEESPSGHLLPCKETHDRSRDIENILSKYPWASPFDLRLALEAWNMGRQSACDKTCTRNKEMEAAIQNP
jgi:hypothetical protein